MNEAENSVTLSKDVSSEIFFQEEARRIREAFNNKSDEQNLDYLRHQLKCMKALTTHLELPWDRLIPILFRCFSSYMQHPELNVNRKKTGQLTAQLIDCMTYMSQNGRMINVMVAYFNQQIEDLDKLLAEENQQQAN